MGKVLLCRGFTLLELLIGLALIYILLALGAPSAKRIVDSHRIAADINHTSALLRFARTHAISQYETVKICPTTDYLNCSRDWRSPLIVFADVNSNNVLDENETLLAARSPLAKQHKMKGPVSPIRFFESGENASPASLIICPVSNDVTLARAIYVSLQGRIRISIDYNGDGIHERIKKTNISCSSF